MENAVYVFGPGFSSFVRSVLLVCEEKGISYQTGTAPFGDTIALGGQEHRELHPFAKFPILLHNERVLIESIVICRYLNADPEYLGNGLSLLPHGSWEQAQHEQWCQVIAGYVDHVIVRQVLLEFAFPKGEGGSVRMDKIAEAKPALDKVLLLLEQQLDDKLFLCADHFTIADALLAPMLDYLCRLPDGMTVIPESSSLLAYRERLLDRPSGSKILQPLPGR